jgi:hypothetical protein
MARTFVYSDDLTVRVEIIASEPDPEDGSVIFRAICWARADADLVAELRANQRFEDTVAVVEVHVDEHGEAGCDV